MVKIKLPILKNYTYSRIIFCLSKKPLTSVELANKLNKNQSLISRQLNNLEKEKYIVLDKKKKQYNKKLFSLNWSKIEEEFYNTTKGFLKEENKYDEKDFVIKKLKETINKTIKQQDYDEILDQRGYRKAVEQTFKNEQFIDFLKFCFSSFQSRTDLTLERLFLGVIRALEENSKYIKGTIIKNKEFLEHIWCINNKLNINTPEFYMSLVLQNMVGNPKLKERMAVKK